jgi:heme exporter protein B
MILASFRFGFSYIDFSMAYLASPIIWVTFFFSGMFSLSPTYKREVDQGTREGLLIAPISPSSIYLGKLLANLMFILGLNLFSLFLFFVFFPIPTPDLLALLTIVILGTIGITCLGNIISAISSNLSQSGIMLPVLLIPVLLFTVVMTAVTATTEIFAGAALPDILEGIKLILVFDIVFLASGYLLIDYILEV